MKVTRVEVFDIHCPERPAWTPVFVRIHTDEGISGLGETFRNPNAINQTPRES